MTEAGRKRRGPVARWLTRLGLLVLVPVASLALFATAFLAAPPADLLRRAALPILQKVLGHERIYLGHLALEPRSRVELRDLWLGPPEGYGLPLLTVDRLLLRYDLSELPKGRLRVLELRVERPVAYAEARGGKLGWLAFLERLPKGEKEPEPAKPPSDFELILDQLVVSGLGAYFDDGQQRAVLHALKVTAKGRYAPSGSAFDVQVALENPDPRRANVAVRRAAASGAPPTEAKLASLLRLDLKVERLQPLKVALALRLEARARALRLPRVLPAAALGLALEARADELADRAQVDGLRLQLDGAELVRLKAAVEGLLRGDRRLALDLERLQLPLDRLRPYLRAFAPGIDAGGELRVEQVRVAGTLDRPNEARLAPHPGRVELTGLWARIDGPQGKAPRLEARGLSGTLRLQAAPVGAAAPKTPTALLAALPRGTSGRARSAVEVTPGASLPGLLLEGELRLASARAPGASLRGLTLRLAGGVDQQGLAPELAGLRLALDVARVGVRHPALGAIELPLHLRLATAAQLRERSAELPELELRLGELLRATAHGHIKGGGRDGVSLALELVPGELGSVVRALPAPLRARLGGRTVRGRTSVKLALRTRLTETLRARVTRTLAKEGAGALFAAWCCTRQSPLPLELDAQVSLDGVTFEDPTAGLRLRGVNDRWTIKTRPGLLEVATDQRLAGLALPKAGVFATGLKLPLAVQLSPSGATVQTRLEAEGLRLDSAGLSSRGLRIRSTFSAPVPLAAVLAGKPVALASAEATVETAVEALSLRQPGQHLHVEGLKTRLAARHAGGARKPVRIALQTTLRGLSHAQQGAHLNNVSLDLESDLRGLEPRWPALPPRIEVLAGDLRLRSRIGRLGLRRVLDRPVEGIALALRTALRPGGTVDLRELSARIPSRGLRLTLSGLVERALTARPERLPPLQLELGAALELPRSGHLASSSRVWPNVRASGKAGLTLRVRHEQGQRLELEGR
ncbi:MAG: hypothetical protein IT371_00830, partial [Deltaproteobacteria bacterium]|nr:hypothetical protein [Deltaproteobacteria bacterium]